MLCRVCGRPDSGQTAGDLCAAPPAVFAFSLLSTSRGQPRLCEISDLPLPWWRVHQRRAVHTPCSNIFSLATTNSTCSRVSDSALGKLTP